MVAKKCRKCGKANPPFFTHCIDCGTKLTDDSRKSEGIPRGVKIAAMVCILVLVVLFVIFPAARYFQAFSLDLTKKVTHDPATQERIVAVYPVNQTVESHGLQIAVNSARDGQNTYNSNKFFLISMQVRNNRTSGNIQISSGDFELTTSGGATYYPYGIGSKVMYDLSPSQDTRADLTFIIPQSTTAEKLRYTLPATSSVANDQAVVIFDL